MPELNQEARAKFSRLENAVLEVYDILLLRWQENFEAGQHWSAATVEGALAELAGCRGRLLEARRAFLSTRVAPDEAQRSLGTHAYRARTLVGTLAALGRGEDAVAPLNDLVNELILDLDQLPVRPPRKLFYRNLRVI